MNRSIAGHRVHTEPADGLAGYWRVFADGTFIGLVADVVTGWHTLPRRTPGHGCGPVCHCPTVMTALETLIAETIDHREETTT